MCFQTTLTYVRGGTGYAGVGVNEILMKHKAMLEQKMGIKFKGRLFLAASLGETLPMPDYEEEKLEESREKLIRSICNYGDYL